MLFGKEEKKVTDIAVIGGGIAGLTAAIYARRAGKSVTVIEKDCPGGQILYSPMVENYPGIPKMVGADFADSLQRQAEDFGTEIEYGEVTALRRQDDHFVVEYEMELEAKAVILAVGASHKRLGLPKEEDLTGCGVSYCAVCDGAFYEGMDVAIQGGGNTALQDAIFLSNVCSSVTVMHRRDEFRGDLKLVRQLEEKENVRFMLSSTVTGLIEKDGELCAITVRDEKQGEERRLPVKGLFIAVGQIPQTGLFKGLVGMDTAGYLSAKEDCESDVPGIFIAGDCRTKEVRQLTTAAADGAIAALAACKYIDR